MLWSASPRSVTLQVFHGAKGTDVLTENVFTVDGFVCSTRRLSFACQSPISLSTADFSSSPERDASSFANGKFSRRAENPHITYGSRSSKAESLPPFDVLSSRSPNWTGLANMKQ